MRRGLVGTVLEVLVYGLLLLAVLALWTPHAPQFIYVAF